ncbi:hypothetical protein F5Y16DRAFT_398199 [Xylariaceae sp. FL0255]|nr:hypothetical protein F5Y16DRAFT_398199 [Xylariaceae sp. FL0255]
MPLFVRRGVFSPPDSDGPGRLMLNTTCPSNNGTGARAMTMIGLDFCLIASDYTLYGQANGSFSHSCHDFQMVNDSTTVFQANCRRGLTTYDLADAITVNDDGILSCFDMLGCAKNPATNVLDMYGDCSEYQIGDGYWVLQYTD